MQTERFFASVYETFAIDYWIILWYNNVVGKYSGLIGVKPILKPLKIKEK